MKIDYLAVATGLSDGALLARMRALSEQSRRVTVELVAHLVEVARRGLHRGEGAGRLFGYVTQVLKFSDAAAWNRIQAARAVRRFPIVLDMLADGSVNLTSVRILVPHLTKENHLALLAEASGLLHARRQEDCGQAGPAARCAHDGPETAGAGRFAAVFRGVGDDRRPRWRRYPGCGCGRV
jgi:hypothetical protein